MAMESGLINSIWRKIKNEDESHEEKISFAERVTRAYENKNTLEYNEAVTKARELKATGYTAEQLTAMGEQAVAELCRLAIVDAAVPVGALKKFEELEKDKTVQ